jgi:precorrin-3B C17-methyltransferase
MSGRVYLVGMGPGNRGNITPEALAALKKAQVIVGHKECIRLIKAFIKNKEVIADDQSPIERSRIAVEKAQGGQEVAIVSSGDPGTYAIASTFLTYLKDNRIKLNVKVIPGLTLASYAAARLGSPLGHDMAIISLADQATPWIDTKKRLGAAAGADFVVTLYNPTGKLGTRRVKEALSLIRNFRPAKTPVGLLRQAASRDEKLELTTLDKVSPAAIQTDTLVIIGNSQTFIYAGYMVTPRAYKEGVGY